MGTDPWGYKGDDVTFRTSSNPDCTFNEFVSIAFHYQPHQRRGQALFNRLVDVRPDLAHRIAGTTVDPFMSNDRITAALDWLEAHWHLDGSDPALWEGS